MCKHVAFDLLSGLDGRVMAGWNGTCAVSNCSGHGMCHEGSCICQFLCIRSEYHKYKNSLWPACRVTVQKLLYVLTIIATAVRGAYFLTQSDASNPLSSNLWSAYYPVVLSGGSLIVCFWAEVFHLDGIQCNKPGFLSKSKIFFAVFNVVLLTLVLSLVVLSETSDLEHFAYQNSIFSGCFAVLMVVVVIFLLIYGVEVFFKLHGAFIQANASREPLNIAQLHMSRLGLVAAACLQLATALFIMLEILKDQWKDKIDFIGLALYDISFRIVEFGVILWFPCVLWNVKRPDQLWLLNPRKILRSADDSSSGDAEYLSESSETEGLLHRNKNGGHYSAIKDGAKGGECWICYDNEREGAGPLIEPCNCKGDMAVAHHECLRKWLMEGIGTPGNLRCKVCNQKYCLKEGPVHLLYGFTKQQRLSMLLVLAVMCGVPAAVYYVCHNLPVDETWLQVSAIGGALLVECLCVRLLGFNAVAAYRRAKIAALQILEKKQDTPSTEEPQTSSVQSENNVQYVQAEVEVFPATCREVQSHSTTT
ncbi:uncharacterized protein LOC106172960 isoform X2 [Lingula anatina]|uniref:Uncharacterized protein LOC106172960 isoform X2 n=1 Tax=Lingula anatina TaxID=7574 RepID=A0A1S3JGU8_LINAN|nr:uncharacterized protein LOC106172960 isoform X2 [Lingula anatina]|eukprot:XP_013409371.1 uncharacterized protein LOC106172960 isoform X2 [Lingula anatina]